MKSTDSDGGLEAIDLDGPAPTRNRSRLQGRPSRVGVMVVVAAAAAITSAAMAWQMRGDRDAARRTARRAQLDLRSDQANVKALRAYIADNPSISSVTVGHQYHATFRGTGGGQLVVLLVEAEPRTITIAVMRSTGEAGALFSFEVVDCASRISARASAPADDSGGEMLALIDGFPPLTESDTIVIVVSEYPKPPRGSTYDGESPINLGRIRAPFGLAAQIGPTAAVADPCR